MSQRMVLFCWMLLLLTCLQSAESLYLQPKPRHDLQANIRKLGNSADIKPDNKSNKLLFDTPNSYPEEYKGNDHKETSALRNYNNDYEINNDDIQRELSINRAIQEVFYPEYTKIRDSGDISFPEYKLPEIKGTEPNKYKGKTPHSNKNYKNYLKNGILQYRYNPNLFSRPTSQNNIKKKTNNDNLQDILDLKDFDLKKKFLKHAFLKKSETYNITDTGDNNNFLLEKKVNVSKNLNYLDSNNQLANFSEFHSSILQKVMANGNEKSLDEQPLDNSFRNYDTAEMYDKKDTADSQKHLNFQDFVGGQFIGEELPRGQHPRSETHFGEPDENHVENIPNGETSAQDFVGGQFISYNKKIVSQPRTQINTNNTKIGAQPSDFVGGQFVGSPEVSENDSGQSGSNNVGTTIESNYETNGKGLSYDENTESYKDQYSNELSSLSILGVQQNNDDDVKEEKDLKNQGILKNRLHKKISQQQDDVPVLFGNRPKFNKGIAKTLNVIQQVINENGYTDQTTVDNVEHANTELGTIEDLESIDLKSDSYSLTTDSFNNADNEITTTEKSAMNSETIAYDDYHENDNLGSILGDGNNVKYQSDEIQGQPSQISSNFIIGTTNEVVDVASMGGVSFEKDNYNTLEETSTKTVKDVYLYAGKDYENDPLDKGSDFEKITSKSLKEENKNEEGESKENYPTEICFPLKNKKDISLFDLLSGNFYLENNGKKTALSLIKNPMKNCTSGTASCKLYLDIKNISQVLEDTNENEEENMVLRNKRQSKHNIFSFIEPQLEENITEWIKNKPAFKDANSYLVLFPLNTNASLPLSQQKSDATETPTSLDESDKDPHEEHNQPTLFPNHEVTMHKPREKRSSTGSESCGCSNLFKSTQIPSYKYFVGKRLGILTNIVVAAQHFMDSR